MYQLLLLNGQSERVGGSTVGRAHRAAGRSPLPNRTVPA